MNKKFGELEINTAFQVNDTWGRDELNTRLVYVKVSETEARQAIGRPGDYTASTMPRITIAAEHPVTPVA